MEKEEYKFQAIKYAWCHLVSVQDFDKLNLDENGYSNWRCRSLMQSHLWDNLSSKLKPGTPKMSSGHDLLYRPKALNGIENNNGWHKISSRSDLPKEAGMYLFLVDNREIQQWCDNDTSFSKSHTHWRDIQEIKKPIY